MKSISVCIALIWVIPLFGQRESLINPDTALQVTDVTVTAERLQLPLSLVSRNVSILSAEDIKKLPVQSVNEALAHVSGVDVRQRGVAGGQADIGIRGSSFDQVLLMI
ncbi:MAG TPA: TonB-dependent receptor plug domain-containing protein, partial [Bacteroidia bacterium]|nr:TonB-dependent receptor plug domain-containing protein [Bacteroidia bacterium]